MPEIGILELMAYAKTKGIEIMPRRMEPARWGQDL